MIAFSLAVTSDRLQALTRAMDAAMGQAARLHIYSAPAPPTGQPPGTAQRLATLTFPQPCLDAVSGTALILKAPPPTLISASGDAAWARIENGVAQFVADLDVGLPGSGAAIIIDNGVNTLRLYAGGELNINLANLVEG